MACLHGNTGHRRSRQLKACPDAIRINERKGDFKPRWARRNKHIVPARQVTVQAASFRRGSREQSQNREERGELRWLALCAIASALGVYHTGDGH